ncbi:CHC2 zinc finger domain-containing protein [Reinekea sp. G2M2-21]|uniref:CHC2 zinc finger domain-containing protein n=1 Tax=Reinekea sp. G2M2-21 TaxID=2788942 RepID=UPI0018ABD316|nr:CHC2 zinc finger domain-containing protein [Reinekea sp. G2M2-21]
MSAASNQKGRITENSIDEILRLDIKEVANSLWPDIKWRGNSASCPLSTHQGDDKTPSFSVTPGKNVFYCFTEQHGGNNLDLVADRYGYDKKRDFRECVEKLAEVMNVTLEYEPLNEQDIEKAKERELAARAMTFAQHQFQAALNELFDGMEKLQTDNVPVEKWPDQYKTLKERDISREFAIEHGIGYAPTDNQFLFKRLKSQGDEAVRAGELADLIKQNADGRYFDFFIGRITYPCIDYRTKQIVGFTGRRVSQQPTSTAPKYKNSPNNVIYNKSAPSALYGFAHALEKSAPEFYDKQGNLRCLLYLEGPNDVSAAQKAGVPAVCGNGIAVSELQMQTMLRYTNEFINGLDQDVAGMKASTHAWLLALENSEGKPISQIPITQGKKDVGEMTPAEIKTAIANRFGPAKAIANAIRATLEAESTMPGQINAINVAQRTAEEFLRKMPDGIEKAKACGQISKMLGVDPALILAATVESKSSIPVQDKSLGPIAETLSTIEKLVESRETISHLESEVAALRASIPERRTQQLPQPSPDMAQEPAISAKDGYRARLPQV